LLKIISLPTISQFLWEACLPVLGSKTASSRDKSTGGRTPRSFFAIPKFLLGVLADSTGLPLKAAWQLTRWDD